LRFLHTHSTYLLPHPRRFDSLTLDVTEFPSASPESLPSVAAPASALGIRARLAGRRLSNFISLSLFLLPVGSQADGNTQGPCLRYRRAGATPSRACFD